MIFLLQDALKEDMDQTVRFLVVIATEVDATDSQAPATLDVRGKMSRRPSAMSPVSLAGKREESCPLCRAESDSLLL